MAPPPYTSGFDDDDFTTDSNTVMTREYESNKESLRLRKYEVEQQLKALEISTRTGGGNGKSSSGTVGGGGGGGSTGGNNSVDSREVSDNNINNNSNNKAPTQHQQHTQFRPSPLPHPIYYGGGVPGYPAYPPPPIPHHSSHMYPGGPSVPGTSNGPDRDVASNGPVHHPPPPFNPYDPHYFAAAAAAHLHQQAGGGLPIPPQPHSMNDPSQDKYLLKLLQEKEEELKSVRKTLEETQARLQEQTLLAARLEATLDQVNLSFQQERQLIQLQAEKKVQEQFQAQQQEIFQKQLDLMDKWQTGGGGGGMSVASAGSDPFLPASAATAQAPMMAPTEALPVLDKPPAPEAPNSSTTITASSGNYFQQESAPSTSETAESDKSDKKYPWNSSSSSNNNVKSSSTGTTASVDQNGIETQKLKDGGGEISNDNIQNSFMDDSLYDSAIMLQPSNHSYPGSDDDDDGKKEIRAAVAMAEATQLDNEMNDSARQAPGTNTNINLTSSTNHVTQQQLASDKFIPVIVDQNSSAAAEYEDFILNNPPDDDRSLGQTVASSTYGEDRVKVVNQSLLDPYGDKGTYTGVVLRSTGMPHDLGRMIYEEDGRIYEGDWKHGRWHGYGRASFSNGDSYEGEYKFDQRHGRGTYKWHDGRVFDGQFLEDKRHGKGIFTWPDGAVYDGDFVNGQREGHGKYTFADGGEYEGSWRDGRYEGFGTCTWDDGRRYRGEWRNGMAHGRGIETYPNGNVRHEGQWIDDEPIR